MKKKLCFDMYSVKMAASDANQEPAYFEFGKGEAKLRCAPDTIRLLDRLADMGNKRVYLSKDKNNVFTIKPPKIGSKGETVVFSKGKQRHDPTSYRGFKTGSMECSFHIDAKESKYWRNHKEHAVKLFSEAYDRMFEDCDKMYRCEGYDERHKAYVKQLLFKFDTPA